MKINVINVAEYDCNEDKMSKVPFSTFANLVGYTPKEDGDTHLSTARFFKTQDEFKALSKSEIAKFDTEREVLIHKNGQFLIFYKEKPKNVSNGGTADTDKDKT